MRETLLSVLQLGLRAAIIAAKSRNGSFQFLFQLFVMMGPRQWLALLAEPIIPWSRLIAFSGRPTTATASRSISSADCANDFDLAGEETLRYEVSDEAVEIASGTRFGAPTLVNTYCFTCPVGADQLMLTHAKGLKRDDRG